MGLTVMGTPALGDETPGGTESSVAQFRQNLAQVGRFELPGAMSIAFSSKRPVAYVSTRGNDSTALAVLDITEPTHPKMLATVAVPDVGQEDLNLAERPDGTAFVLLGPSHPPAQGQNGLTIVDVSDVPGTSPQPRVVGGIPQGSHTWTCLGKECNYAYATVGPGDDLSRFAIVDLRNPAEPKVAGSSESLVSGLVPTHDWKYDEAGIAWAVGGNGIAAYEVTDPTKPKALNISDKNGQFGYSEYNDRLQLHGSLRPNARLFQTGTTASVHSGNVLLLSEEGDDVDCTDSFQTWYVPHLDAAKLPRPPAPNSGTITPLDGWSLLNDTIPGLERPVDPDFCSVHWFDYHQDGFVTMATYRSGTRILDVRDACNIRQIGYNFTEHNAANHSYWVPERNSSGHVNGRASSLVYTADAGSTFVTGVGEVAVLGGIDIFKAAFPAEPRTGCTGP
jgi:hypothetical protein